MGGSQGGASADTPYKRHAQRIVGHVTAQTRMLLEVQTCSEQQLQHFAARARYLPIQSTRDAAAPCCATTSQHHDILMQIAIWTSLSGLKVQSSILCYDGPRL